MIRRLLTTCLLSGLLAVGASQLQPPRYQARVCLQFSALNPQLASHFMKALAASPDGVAPVNLGDGLGFQTQTASLIFRSRAAAQYALENTGAAPATRHRDPAQSLQDRLGVEEVEPAGLVLTLTAGSPAAAKDLLLAITEYYRVYVAKNSLTRVKKTRVMTETRLSKVRKNLAKLEERLARSGSKEMRRLGEGSLKVNPQVMHQIWLRRLDEEARSQELLEQLRQLRAGQELHNADEKWLGEWAGTRKSRPPLPRRLLEKPVGRQELLERAQLERDYYEALLLHRSLTLQHSFLVTWESLESPEFEVIDPVSVRRVTPEYWKYALSGAVLGLLLGVLSMPRGRKNG